MRRVFGKSVSVSYELLVFTAKIVNFPYFFRGSFAVTSQEARGSKEQDPAVTTFPRRWFKYGKSRPERYHVSQIVSTRKK